MSVYAIRLPRVPKRGFGAGVAMGYGSYSVMPIPYHMALTWFLGTLAEALVAAVVVGLLVKD